MQRPLLLLLALTIAAPHAGALLQDAPPQAGADTSKAYRPGHHVRHELTLTDVRSETHRLLPRPAESEKRGEVDGGVVTVLVFWSLRDPLSRGYVPKLAELQDEFADKKVRVYLLASNHDEITSGVGDPTEKIRGYMEKESVTLPILLDHKNKVADLFGAVCANHAFVIGADRNVKFAGGIDNDPQGKLERAGRDVVRWLHDAVEATLEGLPVEHPKTRPSGRPLKRAPVEAGAEGGAEKGS